MASGVTVHDDVVLVYNEMKVRKAGCSEQDRLKVVVFRISDDGKMIIVDEASTLYVRDFRAQDDIFKKVMGQLPSQQCRYMLYDCNYETYESRKEDLVLIMWVPEDAPLKAKMVCAASKSALKLKLQGIKFEWQINDVGESKDTTTLVEKFGGKKAVKSIEGKPV